jgi:hypothetical protein
MWTERLKSPGREAEQTTEKLALRQMLSGTASRTSSDVKEQVRLNHDSDAVMR